MGDGHAPRHAGGGVNRFVSEPNKAVFLSYAREDVVAARRIAEALHAAGVEAWFDQSELRGGDTWDTKLRRQIKECALFIPLVSQHSEARSEGYFRREWKLAVDRTQDMAGGRSFIVPVVIDDTAESDAAVPEEFMRYQWTRLREGEATPDFVGHVKHLLDAPRHKPSLKPGPPRPPTLPPELKQTAHAKAAAVAAPATKKSFPAAALAIALGGMAVGVGLVLFVTLRKQPVPAVAPPPSVATSPAPAAQPSRLIDKSIAVLPFTNMSEEKDNAFFADGVHEDILTNLALIRELRVVSRTSVMSYRATTKPMQQIAAELGVTYILEGSVRRSGNKVRVTGQLIHAATDEHVWAQSYDRDLTDVFTIQAELSQQIAAALKAALSPEEKVFIARKPTSNSAAYDQFLQARAIYNREGNNLAARLRRITLLREAVAFDPAFAAAWGELAVVCAYAAFYGDAGMETSLAQAKEAIERAVQLAPEDPEVIASLGTYHYYGYRDYRRATEQYERLARLQPNSPRVFATLGLIQRRQGRWAEALVNQRRAVDLDPANLTYLTNLDSTLVAARRWDEALVARRRLVALRPGDLRAASSLAALPFLASGSIREIEEFFARLSPAERDSPLGIEFLKNWAIWNGNLSEFVRLDRLQPYYDDRGTPRWEQAFDAAQAYYLLGDVAGAKARLGDFPAELRARLQREPGNFRQLSFLSAMESLLDHHEEALRLINRATELMPVSRDAVDGAFFAFFRAWAYDMARQKDVALAEYGRLMRVPLTGNVLNVHFLRAGYRGPLRGDPAFEALLNDPQNNEPLF